MKLTDQSTPSLVLNRGVLLRNIRRMHERARKLGVSFRPHVKTCKSIEVARLLVEGQTGGITVSTLQEARYFQSHGFNDITYAIGIDPGKLRDVARLIDQGADIKILLDEPAAAKAVISFGKEHGVDFKILLEVDSDGHRAGFRPGDRRLSETGRIVKDSTCATIEGVLTHGGSSYGCRSSNDIAAVAELERAAVVAAAKQLRDDGVECRTISVGSTPSATFGTDLSGVTELRAGVFVFQDLFQVGLGVCSRTDIAIAVMAAVIGYKRDPNRLVIDAGALALSKDRSTAALPEDLGFGIAQRLDAPWGSGELVVEQVFQEHGIVAPKTGTIDLGDYPIGSRLFVFPNHACITAAAHNQYLVIDDKQQVTDVWTRCNGW